jgi:uncharacterized protein (TIGR03435 family)
MRASDRFAFLVCASLAVLGQTPQPTALREFEVASIRPSNPNTAIPYGSGVPVPGLQHRRFTYSGTLFATILGAYDVKGCGPFRVTCALLLGGATWIRKDRFDIQGKAPENSPDYTFAQLMDGQAPQLQSMLQALLTERFSLKVHREQRVLAVYALTVARKGPTLKPTAGETWKLPDGTTVKKQGMSFTVPRKPDGEFDERKRQMIVQDGSIQELANDLSNFLDRPVVNRTGIEGRFDITLEYEPDAVTGPGEEPTSGAPFGGFFGSSFFAALQDQLGLKMEATKAMVEVLVIDHAEQPSRN